MFTTRVARFWLSLLAAAFLLGAGPVLAAGKTCEADLAIKLQQRNIEISSKWAERLRTLSLPLDGTVVEVGPGSQPKIGMALKEIGFHGRLIVIEPQRESGEKVTALYRRLLPGAQVELIDAKLADSLPLIHGKVDALLANHLLDDMLLGAFMNNGAFQKFFADHYDFDSSIEGTRDVWARITANPALLANAHDLVVKEYLSAVRTLHPQYAVIFQYPSLFFAENNFPLPDQQAAHSLQRIFQQASLFPQWSVSVAGDWLEIRQKNLVNLTALPGAMDRLGQRMFVKAWISPLRPENLDLVYVDEEALNRIGLTGRDEDKLKGIIGWEVTANRREDSIPVWVDRQEDPSGIAMNGNIGSGRAHYLGKILNLKGNGRTPLAKADKDDSHGNGLQDMYRASWEGLNASVLRSDTSFGSAAIPLVAVNKGLKYNFDREMRPAAIEMRVDEGALDRPTHALHPLAQMNPAPSLQEMAANYGRQEADKFMERLIQGAFSSGNVSLNGATLDLETAGSVIGRNAQFSLTGRWQANYFGYEDEGALQVLSQFRLYRPQFSGNMSEENVKEVFRASYQKEISQRLLDLMGFDSQKVRINAIQTRNLDRLAAQFQKLARLSFPDFETPRNKEIGFSSSQVFDFSRFFRFYPTAKNADLLDLMRTTKFDEGRALSQLGVRFKEALIVEGAFTAETYALLTSQMVKTQQELTSVEAEAKKFIELYQELVTALLEQNGMRREDLAPRAFALNDDRPYLTPGLGRQTVFMLGEGYFRKRISREELAEYLSWVRKISLRRRAPNELYLDARLMNRGVLYRRMVSKSFHVISFAFYKHEKTDMNREWILRYDGEDIPLRATQDLDGRVVLTSRAIPNVKLDGKPVTVAITGDGIEMRLRTLNDSSPSPGHLLKVEEF